MKNKPNNIMYFFKTLLMFLAVYWLLMPILNGVIYSFDGGVVNAIYQHIVNTPVGILGVFFALAALFTYRKTTKQPPKDEPKDDPRDEL